jgi:hypothetical protein
MRRLNENAVVTFGLPSPVAGHGTGQGVVIAISGKTVSVLALNPEVWARMTEEIIDVYMTFASERALVSLKGKLFAPDERHVMRFMVTDDAHVRADRPTRARVELPVTLTLLGTGESADGTTIDISTNGLRLATDLCTELGDRLECGITVPTGASGVSVRLLATVVHISAGELAITFSRERTPLALRLAIFDLVTRVRLEALRGGGAPRDRGYAHDSV